MLWNQVRTLSYSPWCRGPFGLEGTKFDYQRRPSQVSRLISELLMHYRSLSMLKLSSPLLELDHGYFGSYLQQIFSKVTSIEPCLLRLSRYRGCYYLLGMIWVAYCLYISKYCYAAFNCGDQRRIVDCRACDAIVNNISNTNLSNYI